MSTRDVYVYKRMEDGYDELYYACNFEQAFKYIDTDLGEYYILDPENSKDSIRIKELREKHLGRFEDLPF